MKKTIAIILTILMAASTFTACSQANGVAESSVDGSPETTRRKQRPQAKRLPPKLRLCRAKQSLRQLSRASRKRPTQAKIRAMWRRITAITEKGQQAHRQVKMRRLFNSKKPNQRQKKNHKPHKNLKRRVHRKQLISPKHRANLKLRKNWLLRNSQNSSRLTSDASQAR